MTYTPFVVPVRTPIYDDSGRLSRQWEVFFADVARKAGRAMLWRGEYREDTPYSVCDVVRLKATGEIYSAKQANPVNGNPVTPGTNEDVWELIHG